MDVPAKGNILGKYVPARYILAGLGSIGMAIVYGLKVNLSVAMVGMLNHTVLGHDADNATEDDEVQCLPAGGAGNATEELDGPSIWPSEIQGIVLSCYFWGYFVSQIPGARVAELFSAKWVMFFSVALNVICTLLTPVMAEAHYIAAVVMRVGEGIGGGVTFPAMHVLLSKWAPPAERSVMAALVYAGTSLGTVISMLMAGVLTANVGWESVFYVMGGLSTIWCVLWVSLVQDSPQQQALISIEERKMIVTSLGGNADDHCHKHQAAVPWKAVFTSPPFLAILVSHACSNWGWYMLLIELPFYMKQVLKFNMTENAVITALPFLSLWIFSMGLSKTLDSLRVRNVITTTTARKIGTLFASIIPACCLLALCYIGCNRPAAVALMTIAVTCIGGMFCGFLSNHIDIAPNYAGTLMAVTNTVATVPGIVVPIFVGVLTHGNQKISAWRVIFFVTIALYIIEIIVYSLFGSGEEQPWNKVGEKLEVIETEPLSNGTNASIIPACCLLALCYIGCNRPAAVALMTIAVTCIGGMFCGFLSNHIDIAPNYAGTLMAVTNTVATVPGIVVPIFVGVLTHGNQKISAWRVIFFVTIALYIIEIIVYSLFGSGEEQPWNKVGEKLEVIETEPLSNGTNGEKNDL